jgi:SAM-dependent methyltransferase
MSNGLIISFLLLFVFILCGWILSILTSIVFSPSVHTPKDILGEILALLKLREGEKLYDLGSGDGRVLIGARKIAKVKGFGYEISPIMVSISKIIRFVNLGFNTDMLFEVESIFDIKLKDATKVYVYQNPKILTILHKKFERELDGVSVYSYKYEIPEKKGIKHELSNGELLFEYKY